MAEKETDKSMEKVVDNKLVNEVYDGICDRYLKHANNLWEDIAIFIIDKFYDGEPQRVLDKNPVYKMSRDALFDKMEGADSQLPRKTWLYNAIKVYADGKMLESKNKSVFRTYGKLLPTQKVEIARIQKEEHEGAKFELIKEAVKTEMPVRRLRKEVSEIIGVTPSVTKIDFNNKIKVIHDQVVKWQGQVDKALTQGSKHSNEFTELKKALKAVMTKIEKLEGS